MNRWFAYLTAFVSGTLAKSSEVNARFGEIVGAFDDVQDEVNVSLRGPATEAASDLARLPAAADRATKLLQFDALGNPVASSSLLADLNVNGKAVTGLVSPLANDQPVTLGFLTGYSAALAGLPPIIGMAGRTLTTDGLGVQWTVPSSPGTMTTDAGAMITSFAGVPTWQLPGQNLVLDPNGIWGSQYWFAAGLAAPTSLNAVVEESGLLFRNTAPLVAANFDHTSSEITCGAGLPVAAAVDTYTAGVTSGALLMAVRFYDAAHVFLSESVSVPITIGLLGRRWGQAITSPVNSAFCRWVLRGTAVNAVGAGLKVRNVKVEIGTNPTPFTDDATKYEIGRYKAQYTYGAGQITTIMTLGDATTTTSIRDFRSAAGAQAYDVRLKVTGGTPGVAGKAALDIESYVTRNTGPIGYTVELDNGNGGAAITLNLQLAAYQRLVLNNAGACAITLDGTKQPLAVGRYRLKIVQDATGGRPNPTWAGITVTWLGAITPVVAVGANAITFVDFYWDGITLFGSFTAWS